MQRIGFIGIGLMGHGMAKNLLAKGHPLAFLAHRNRRNLDDLLKLGAKEVKSPAEIASGLRLSSNAGTARGFGVEEFRQIGRWILDVIAALARSPEDGVRTADALAPEVTALARRFPIYEERS